MARELRRVCDGRYDWLGGVCAGLGYSLGIHILLIRLTFVLFVVFISPLWGVLSYIFLWTGLSKWRKTPDDFERFTRDKL